MKAIKDSVTQAQFFALEGLINTAATNARLIQTDSPCLKDRARHYEYMLLMLAGDIREIFSPLAS